MYLLLALRWDNIQKKWVFQHIQACHTVDEVSLCKITGHEHYASVWCSPAEEEMYKAKLIGFVQDHFKRLTKTLANKSSAFDEFAKEHLNCTELK